MWCSKICDQLCIWQKYSMSKTCGSKKTNHVFSSLYWCGVCSCLLQSVYIRNAVYCAAMVWNHMHASPGWMMFWPPWPPRGHVRMNNHKFWGRVHWNTTKSKSKSRDFKRRVFSGAETLPILSLFLLFSTLRTFFFIKPQHFVLRSGSDWGVWVSCIPSRAPDASTLCGNTTSRGTAGWSSLWGGSSRNISACANSDPSGNESVWWQAAGRKWPCWGVGRVGCMRRYLKRTRSLFWPPYEFL